MTKSLNLRALLAPRTRRIGYAVLALVFAILTLFPQPFVARAKLLPQDSSGGGLGQVLSSLGGQLSNFAGLLSGGKPPNDLYLVIGRSNAVVDLVVRSLDLVGPGKPYATDQQAQIALAKRVDIHLLLGGVLEIEAQTDNPAESLKITNAYVAAIQDRIGAMGLESLRRKRQVIEERYREANDRVREAQQRLDAFRAQNKLAAPEAQLGSAIAVRAQVQANLAARQAELNAVQQVAGPENPRLAVLQGEVASLQAQIARSQRSENDAGGPNLTGLSSLQSQYYDLYRDYRFAQALYEVYTRAIEQTVVETLVSSGSGYVQVIEPPHVDAERHYNIPALALMVMVLALAAFTEIYVPLTGLDWAELTHGTRHDDAA